MFQLKNSGCASWSKILRACSILALGSSAFAGVTVTTPVAGTTTTSPVHVVASATSGAPISALRIYVDGVSTYTVYTSSMDTSVSMSTGTHTIVVQAWDTTGAVQKNVFSLGISGSAAVTTPTTSTTSTATSTIPSNATTFSNVQSMAGWEVCTVCAGANANGPVADFAQVQHQTSPSMSGDATQFWVGGTTPYSDVHWWRQLGGTNSSNFTYDLYFYMTAPQYAQAIEFDVNHSINGLKYIFGTQCNIRDRGTWDIWDTANVTWVSTGIPCAAPPAYQWNHVVWEFQRTIDNKVLFVSLTYNGTKYYINRTFYPRSVSAYEVNTAFQIDGDYAQHAYSVWVDKMNLSTY